MSPEEQVFVIPPSRQNENLNCSVSVHKFQISKIRNIEKRRYLLQPIALELFLQNGRTYLIAFERTERQKALQRIVQYATHARSTDPSAMMSNLTSKWENGEISNFEYIVILNTWAGRTYNDLMQYPVFPWVLSDYDSNVLDFTKSETFRDFSLPMGGKQKYVSTDNNDVILKSDASQKDIKFSVVPTRFAHKYLPFDHRKSLLIGEFQ